MDQSRQLSAEDQRKMRDIAAATNRRNRLAREKRDTEIVARREEAWIEVHRLLHRFREIDPNIDHLILFGSLARGDMKRPDFDIDELCRFRHAFRHIYDSRIEPDKLMIAQSRVARRKPIVAGPPHGRGRLKGTDER